MMERRRKSSEGGQLLWQEHGHQYHVFGELQDLNLFFKEVFFFSRKNLNDSVLCWYQTALRQIFHQAPQNKVFTLEST